MKTGWRSRRKFVKTSAIAGGGMLLMPAYLKGMIHRPPSDKLNIAFIGCGGQGGAHITALLAENYVAFCDVDEVRASKSFAAHPNVPRYSDYRKMLDEMHDQIDAVVIATPDHTHAVATLACMELGKHVYVEKPLTHSIGECRALLAASEKYGVVTQMGNQGASMDCNRVISEWIQAGVIGDVHTVHVWTNRPVWPQGVPAPVEKIRAPKTMQWDLWIGPAPYRAYHPAFAPFKWRGWWDYGTGALGDMGCHLVDPAYRALKLTVPYAVEANATTVWVGDFVEANYSESCPPSSVVKMDFHAREKMPECTMWWYDGGIRPMRPIELASDEPFGSWDGGVLFEGTDGKLTCGIFGENPTLLPTNRMLDFVPPDKTIPRVEGNHQSNWVRACRGLESASSPFEYAVPLTESLLIGNLAVRGYDFKKLQPGKRPDSWAPYDYPARTRLLWDAEQMRVTNSEEANAFVTREYRVGW
jgi:predicted dehydrogenase